MLATAIEVGATTLVTYDRDDFPVGQMVDDVLVRTPFLPAGLAQELIPGMESDTGAPTSPRDPSGPVGGGRPS